MMDWYVIRTFLKLKIANIDPRETHYIKKKVLRNTIYHREKEMSKMERDLAKHEDKLRAVFSTLDFYVLVQKIGDNVRKKELSTIKSHHKKLSSLTKNTFLPFNHKETVNNLSSFKLTEEQLDILKNGLTHAIPPNRVNKTDILVTFDLIHRMLKNDLKRQSDKGVLKTQISHLANTYVSSYKASKTTIHKHKILKQLSKNTDIVITKPDKGNGVVILNRKDYDNMINDILNDRLKFKKLDHDPTLLREGKLQRYLLKLKKKGFFSDDDYKMVYPTGSSLARVYGLPKTHKVKVKGDKLKLRPIISSIGTFNYGLAKFLTNKLGDYIPSKYTVKDSFTFVKNIEELDVRHKFLVSYDVESLFTNIPLKETIDIAVKLIIENEPQIKINAKELQTLFEFATSLSHFSFNGIIYDQVDGVAMGSPLGPVLANVFMGFHENNWILNYSNDKKPLYYARYVDDIFCLFHDEKDSEMFLNYLNDQHNNIKFTIEKETEGRLSFLDTKIDKTQGVKPSISVFRKSTFTGLMINFLSYNPFSYKISVVKSMIHRIYSLCNTEKNIQCEPTNF